MIYIIFATRNRENRPYAVRSGYSSIKNEKPR